MGLSAIFGIEPDQREQTLAIFYSGGIMDVKELIKEWEKEGLKREVQSYVTNRYEQGYINALHRCIQDIQKFILTNKEGKE